MCVTCVVIGAGDRYDSEPRSRGFYDQPSSRYDEDPRGPFHPYSDKGDESSSQSQDLDRKKDLEQEDRTG